MCSLTAKSSEARAAADVPLPLGTGALGALFIDGWGPAWQFAAAAGLLPYGPLALAGIWKSADTERAREGS